MNTSGLGSSSKRAVLDTSNGAGSVPVVFLASPLFGLLRVLGSGEVRPFAANQSGSLLGFGFLGSDFANPGLSNLLSGFFRSDISSGNGKKVRMALPKMLGLADAFKVLKSIVGLVVVDVVNLFAWVKAGHPKLGHNTMQKPLVSNKQVAVFGGRRIVGSQLSENFPATGNGVVVIEESVFNIINFCADHVVAPNDFGIIILNQTRGKV